MPRGSTEDRRAARIRTMGAKPAHAPENHPALYADILSQAVTGELVGMQNYASMVGVFDAVEDQVDAVQHAFSELGHANAFRAAAEQLGVEVVADPAAPYWARVRAAFLDQVRSGDASGCLLVQEVMLEAFAVALYHSVADVTDGRLGRVFRTIGDEEGSHLEHAVEELRAERAADPVGFDDRARGLHDAVIPVLTEMLAPEDTRGHCGLCAGDCVKGSLAEIGLSTAELRGRSLQRYLETLDAIGVPGETSLGWVANLTT